MNENASSSHWEKGLFSEGPATIVIQPEKKDIADLRNVSHFICPELLNPEEEDKIAQLLDHSSAYLYCHHQNAATLRAKSYSRHKIVELRDYHSIESDWGVIEFFPIKKRGLFKANESFHIALFFRQSKEQYLYLSQPYLDAIHRVFIEKTQASLLCNHKLANGLWSDFFKDNSFSSSKNSITKVA